MSACYCEGEPAEVYVKTAHRARRVHRCSECGRAIERGEVYERVFAVWEGDPETLPMCFHCLSMIEFVTASIPCFCWLHHSLHEDVQNAIEEYAHEAPGLRFGWLRRKHAIGQLRRPTADELAAYRRRRNDSTKEAPTDGR